MDIKQQLKTGKKKLGVWGLGYIGFSSIAYFARAGVTCIGTDPNPIRVDDVNNGKVTIPNLDFWLGFDTRQLAESKRMSATTDWDELIKEDVAVHLVAVPTEKNGKPHHDILKEVMIHLSTFRKLNLDKPPLVIIESTLTPTVMDRVIIPLFREYGMEVGKDILLGAAPRRDWFTTPDKRLETLPRVVGGTTKETTDMMADVLGIICQNIIKAPDHKHAVIVKSVENAYRQIDITLANQLSLAYPELDMISILKMAATKWNLGGVFHPSCGIGGYCVDLAPRYLLEGAEYPEQLTLFKESLKTNALQPGRVVDSIIKRGAKKVAVLGICYTGDLKVHVLSPSFPIIKKLMERGLDVKVHDPYYTEQELKELTGADVFKLFPEGLADRDTIVIVSPHMKYKYTSTEEILKNLPNAKLILDNMGIWNDIKFPNHIKYHEAGDAGWLK